VKVRQFKRVAVVFAGLGFAALFAPRCSAQSEISPDHFELSNVESFSKSTANSLTSSLVPKHEPGNYSGSFHLPYEVLCAGKKLQTGEYSFFLEANEKKGHITLRQNGRVVQIPAKVVLETNNTGHNSLIVQHLGRVRRLAEMHFEKFSVILSPQLVSKQHLGANSARTERVPIT
jgi:hypothetical protein